MRAEHFSLDDFLEQQSRVGEIESEGDFTISYEKALEKLARFNLPREYAWVSKLVQAAVAWSMHALEIRQSNTETQFHFLPGAATGLPARHEVLQAMVRTATDSTLAVNHLSLAL